MLKIDLLVVCIGDDYSIWIDRCSGKCVQRENFYFFFNFIKKYKNDII